MSHEESATTDDTAPNGVSRAIDGSRLVDGLRRVGDRIKHVVQRSWLYRWLTAEPEPDVIVIDLRETWTVGPVLRLLDWAIGIGVDAADDSHAVAMARSGAAQVRAAPLRVGGVIAVALSTIAFLAALLGDLTLRPLVVGGLLLVAGVLGVRDDRSWEQLRETRTVELLIAVFEPPNPPEREDREEDNQDDEHRND